jgi:hypothetical protein
VEVVAVAATATEFLAACVNSKTEPGRVGPVPGRHAPALFTL